MIIDSPIISGSYAATGSLNQVGNVTITGSLTVTGPIIGALTGSVDSASFATTASYVSPNTQINTASFATTASYARTVDFNNTVVTSSFAITASYVSPATQINTSSFAVTASYARTVDFNNTVATSSYSLTASYVSPTIPIDTASFAITASYVSPNTQINTASFAITASYVSPNTQINTASFAITASYVSPNTQINTSSFAITSSYALNAELLDGLDSSVFTPTGSFNSYTASNDATVTSVAMSTALALASIATLTSKTGSYTLTSSFNSYTSSNDANVSCVSSMATAALVGVAALAARTGSYATTGSNTFDGGAYFSSSFNPTGFTTTASLYTDGGLRVTRDAYISGTLYLNNVTVFGTQSVAYISSSQLNIGTNIITVNTDTPTVRFGGLAVYDSGSTGLTGSILWDSEQNHWVYTNPSGSTYSGGMFISGPRASSLGTEQGTTACRLLVGQGGDHLTSSMIYHSSTVTCIPNILAGGVGCFSGGVCSPAFVGGTVSGTTGAFSSCITAGARSFVTGTPGYLFDVQTTDTNKPRFQVYVDDTNGVDLVSGYDTTAKGLRFNTGGNIRANITSTGIICFACQVCAPSFISSGTICSTGNTCFGGMSIINSCLGIGTATPGAKLQVYGDLQIHSGATGCSDPLIFGGETGAPKKAIFLENFWMVYQGHDAEGHKFRSVNAEGACTDDVIITGGGNVGIGIPSPAYKLDVNGTGRFTACSCVQENIIAKSANTGFSKINIDSVTGASSQLAFLENETQKGVVGYRPSTCNVFLANATGDILTISCTGTSAFSGNVGINGGVTTSPLTIKVATNQNVRISSETSTSIQAVNDAANAYVVLKVDGSCLLLNTQSGGNVGIGTTSPSEKLVIAETTNPSQITLKQESNFNCGVIGQLNYIGGGTGAKSAMIESNRVGGSATNAFRGGDLRFYTKLDDVFDCLVERVRITSEGNVSIGTTSPSSTYGTLTVAGTGISIADDGNAKLQIGRYSSTVCNAYIKMGTNACSLRFTNAADTVDVVVMEKSGNVGIGTATPQNLLHLGVSAGNKVGIQIGQASRGTGFIGMQAAASIPSTFVIGTDVTSPILFGHGVSETDFSMSTERMRISSGGLISINQTSGYAIFNVTGIDCAWGEGIVMNSAPNGYNAINFRLEGRAGSCFTGTWQLGKESSSTGNGELFTLNKAGLTGGAGYRADAAQQWKTNGDSIFGFKVGIGTTSPNSSSPLHIKMCSNSNGDGIRVQAICSGGAGSQPGIAFANVSDAKRWSISLDNTSDIIQITNATGASALVINQSGISCFIGVVCSPYVSTNTIELGGSATSPSAACIGYGMFGYSGVGLGISAGANGPNQGIGFFVCGVERGRWITNGNLGVGTVCPLVRLDVVGSMYVRSGTFYTDTIAGYTAGTITSTASILPNTNGTLDLGSSSNRWCTVYTSDLSLNNGIGNYTIVEGESDLFLYNNNSCKVFKFLLQEVCPEIAPAKRSI